MKRFRFLAWVLVSVLAVSMQPRMYVSAEGSDDDGLMSTVYQGVHYNEEEDGRIYITEYEQEETDTDLLVVMPSLYDTGKDFYYYVDGIKDGVFRGHAFSRILIGVTSDYMIGRDAFYGVSL